jgi:hypothetical protein
MIGSDGWKFLGTSYSNIVAEAKGISQFNDSEIERITENLTDQARWLSDKNIPYIIAIAPEKLSVYGEFLPIQKSDRPTKLDQLESSLTSGPVRLVDMSDYFKDHPGDMLYFKTDSHWNDFGAYLGYLRIMNEIKKIHPAVDALPLEHLDKSLLWSGPQDLNVMLRLDAKEQQVFLSVREPKSVKLSDKYLPIPENIFTDLTNYEERFTNSSKKLKILFFRDSFGSALMKYFAESFGETVFVFSKFSKDIIELEKPDIVVFEKTERNLDEFIEK